MLAVISPAKTLDFSSPLRARKATTPEFTAEAVALADTLSGKSAADLAGMMDLSDELATLNHDRFQAFRAAPSAKATRQALYAFMGDVYVGLDARTLTASDVAYAQKRLRILSGLYGLLRPLDAIQPYRLEMGTVVAHDGARDLYRFWGARPALALAAQAAAVRTRYLVNLASQEYFKAVDRRALTLEVVTPVFKDRVRDEYRVVSFFAKRARGMMARFIIERRCRKPSDLVAFDSAGYRYDAAQSTPLAPVFLRDAPPSEQA
jgi:cytoplasmic iron level regulating protein YaaA (DUF328/UPF0246 family)